MLFQELESRLTNKQFYKVILIYHLKRFFFKNPGPKHFYENPDTYKKCILPGPHSPPR